MNSKYDVIKLKNLQILKVDKKIFNAKLIKREFEQSRYYNINIGRDPILGWIKFLNELIYKFFKFHNCKHLEKKDGENDVADIDRKWNFSSKRIIYEIVIAQFIDTLFFF